MGRHTLKEVNDMNWLNIVDASLYAGVSTNTMRQAIHDGLIPLHIIGHRSYKIKKADIDKALESNVVDPSTINAQ